MLDGHVLLLLRTFAWLGLGAHAQNTCLTGQAAISGDWRSDAPGVCRHITVADLPAPVLNNSAVNFPVVVPRPPNAQLLVPAGFIVEEFFSGLEGTNRLIRTAPNGDIFVARSFDGTVLILRAPDGAATPSIAVTYAAGLDKCFGIAFWPLGPNPQYVYVGSTGSVVRYPYHNGDLIATGPAEVVVASLPHSSDNTTGHFTRDLAFSPDGKKLYVAVGSHSNVAEDPNGQNETNRATIMEYNPDGTGFRIYASGIRNPVGITFNPTTGQLWASVNERDGLGDNLVPDYITHIRDGGFYGWPWYYLGSNQDPRHAGKHPELRNSVIVPDVLLQSHSASLEMVFYTGQQFPAEYSGDAFAAEHGSWNRARRTGYKVIRVRMQNGVATGEYVDFLTGFVTPDGAVWGRPVGVTVARDGALLVSDDGSGTIWRVSYVHSLASYV